jgi:hypothetical protein
MEENIMAKRSKGRIWWLLLLILAIAGIGYYLYSQKEPEQKKALAPEKATLVAPERLKKGEPSTAQITEKEPQALTIPKKEEQPEQQPEKPSEQLPLQPPWQRPEQLQKQTPLKPETKKDYCAEIEKEIAEFFQYLDHKNYVKKFDPNRDSYARFKDMLKRCSVRPPVPAGEGMDPKILIGNLYHFFRVLGREDLKLIRRVILNEQDSMEYILAMLYKWITLDDRCPDPEGVRPSLSVRYQHAGFFLNTTGGRAYLYRRTQGLRLLANFYCLLIIHQADKNGENRYGLDVVPHIAPLKAEIRRFTEFDFQREYLKELDRIAAFYNKRR